MVQELIVRCRGLPFSCTESELKEWLGGRDIAKVILPQDRDGRASGEGFVTFTSEAAYEQALKKDRENMGHRYVEVFAGSAQDIDIAKFGRSRGSDRGGGYDRGGSDRYDSRPTPRDSYLPSGEFVVRLRGLPFGVSHDEIRKFFAPLEIVRDGVVIPPERRGARSAGEAFVVFVDRFNAEEALKRDKQNIQHRYIEVFESSQSDMQRIAGSGGGMPPSGGRSRERDLDFRGGLGEDYGRGAGGPMGGGSGGRMRGDDYYPREPMMDRYRPRPSPYDRPEPARGRADNRDPYDVVPPYAYSGFEGYRGGPPAPAPSDPYAGFGGRPAGGPPGGPFGGPGGYERGMGGPGGYDRGALDPYADYGSPKKAPGGYGGSEYGSGGPGGYGYGGTGDYDMYGGARSAPQPLMDNWRGGAAVPREREGHDDRDRYAGRRFLLKMRGIPYRTVEADIYEFFASNRPTRVELLSEPGGRPSGEARVEFATRAAYDEALGKDKQYMGSRYVELFPDTSRY